MRGPTLPNLPTGRPATATSKKTTGFVAIAVEGAACNVRKFERWLFRRASTANHAYFTYIMQGGNFKLGKYNYEYVLMESVNNIYETAHIKIYSDVKMFTHEMQ